MDPLDTWLNSQRGWRHFAVAWLTSLPAGVALSLAWAAESDLFGPMTPGASAVLGRMALGVVASVPLAVLLLSVESLSRRRPSKRGKNRMPRYLWRGIAAIYVFVADNAYAVFADTHPLQWRRQHGFFSAQIGLYAIAIVLMFWNLRYWRRAQRRTAEVAGGAVAADPGPANFRTR